jgi:MFS family permease
VPTVTRTTVTDQAGTTRLCAPRDDLVLESPAPVGDGAGDPLRFTLAQGPFDHWERTVTVSPQVPAEGAGRAEPRDQVVTETITFRLALPVWRVVFTPLVRRAVVRPASKRRNLWWLSPDRLDADVARTLARLCLLSMAAGYLGTLLTQTNTFAKAQFDSSDTALSAMLATVRVAALLALVVVAVADRRGRRAVLLWSAVAACVLAATGALTPDLAWLGISQTAARTASTSMAIIIGIFAIEEMPAGSRAYAVSVLAMCAALGAGVCVAVLPLADLGVGGWRFLYVIPLAFLPAVAWQARRLHETRRFLAAGPAEATQSHVAAPAAPDASRTARRAQRRRFALLASSALLLSLFTTPASQLLNEYLRTERGFTAVGITLFTILTNTPGGIGIIVGGRLADLRGRRIVGAVAVGGGVGFTVAMFVASGPWIWVWSAVGAIVGAAAVPALGVYGPELFPTASRGSANGGINVAAVTGAVVGLLTAGYLSDLFGGLPAAMAILAVGPAIVVLLVVFAYPETAHRELEDINPTDHRPTG